MLAWLVLLPIPISRKLSTLSCCKTSMLRKGANTTVSKLQKLLFPAPVYVVSFPHFPCSGFVPIEYVRRQRVRSCTAAPAIWPTKTITLASVLSSSQQELSDTHNKTFRPASQSPIYTSKSTKIYGPASCVTTVPLHGTTQVHSNDLACALVTSAGSLAFNPTPNGRSKNTSARAQEDPSVKM